MAAKDGLLAGYRLLDMTGEKGALTLYGKSGLRPEFDVRRT